MAAVLPDRMAINGKLALPGLDVVEHGHRLGADHGEPPLAIGVEPRREQMAADIVGKMHVEMREIAQAIEQRRSLAAHLVGLGAGDGEDHRQIVRSQVPQGVVLCMELAEAQPVRVDVADLAEFAVVDERLELLEGGVEAQYVADHENPAVGLGEGHLALGILDRQRDGFLDKHVLAILHRPGRRLCMELRRQRHDDGVDIVASEQVVRRDRQAFLLAGEAFGPGGIGIRNRVKRTQALQGADVVGTPVSASEDCNARFHQRNELEDFVADT